MNTWELKLWHKIKVKAKWSQVFTRTLFEGHRTCGIEQRHTSRDTRKGEGPQKVLSAARREHKHSQRALWLVLQTATCEPMSGIDLALFNSGRSPIRWQKSSSFSKREGGFKRAEVGGAQLFTQMSVCSSCASYTSYFNVSKSSTTVYMCNICVVCLFIFTIFHGLFLIVLILLSIKMRGIPVFTYCEYFWLINYLSIVSIKQHSVSVSSKYAINGTYLVSSLGKYPALDAHQETVGV